MTGGCTCRKLADADAGHVTAREGAQLMMFQVLRNGHAIFDMSYAMPTHQSSRFTFYHRKNKGSDVELEQSDRLQMKFRDRMLAAEIRSLDLQKQCTNCDRE